MTVTTSSASIDQNNDLNDNYSMCRWFESFETAIMTANAMLKLSVHGTHDLADFTSALTGFRRDLRSGMRSKARRQPHFEPDPPYFQAKRNVRNNYPPAARCKLHVEVWCVCVWNVAFEV